MMAILAAAAAMAFKPLQRLVQTPRNVEIVFMRVSIKMALVLCTALPLSSCGVFGPDSIIEGVVLDNFGKPIAGANVNVESTGFKTTTDESGSFAVEYVPGTFSITISSEGHTTRSQSLSIAQPSRYPLDETILYKKPPVGGVFLVGSREYVPLLKAKVDIEKLGTAGFGHEKFRYRITVVDASEDQVSQINSAVQEALSKNLEELRIANSSAATLAPYFIGADLIGTATIGLMGSSGSFSELEERTSNLNGFMYGSILKPKDDFFASGSICYVQVRTNARDQKIINEEGAAYCLPGSELSGTRIRPLSEHSKNEIAKTLEIVPGQGVGPISLGELDSMPVAVLGKPSRSGVTQYGTFQSYNFNESTLYVYSDTDSQLIKGVRLVKASASDPTKAVFAHLPKIKGTVSIGSSLDDVKSALGEPLRQRRIGNGSCGIEGVEDVQLSYDGVEVRYCGSVIDINIKQE